MKISIYASVKIYVTIVLSSNQKERENNISHNFIKGDSNKKPALKQGLRQALKKYRYI